MNLRRINKLSILLLLKYVHKNSKMFQIIMTMFSGIFILRCCGNFLRKDRIILSRSKSVIQSTQKELQQLQNKHSRLLCIVIIFLIFSCILLPLC